MTYTIIDESFSINRYQRALITLVTVLGAVFSEPVRICLEVLLYNMEQRKDVLHVDLQHTAPVLGQL